MIVKFNWYLHDNMNRGEKLEFLKDNVNADIDHEKMLEDIGGRYAFYEVRIECEYDTETGDFRIVCASET